MTIRFDDYLKNIKVLDTGCWIYPTGSDSVLYDGRKMSAVRAIFYRYNKVYDGRTTRSCGNLLCLNPEHLDNRHDSFWSHVDVMEDDAVCWEWRSIRGSGRYGSTSYNGKPYITHRLAYELYNESKIPDGMCVCHKCDNPPCCNPHHLFLGTNQDNVDDRESKGKNKMPMSRGEEHGTHKLTEAQVKEIRGLYESGEHSYFTLAGMYGVSFGNIRKIVKGKTWGWLK